MILARVTQNSLQCVEDQLAHGFNSLGISHCQQSTKLQNVRDAWIVSRKGCGGTLSVRRRSGYAFLLDADNSRIAVLWELINENFHHNDGSLGIKFAIRKKMLAMALEPRVLRLTQYSQKQLPSYMRLHSRLHIVCFPTLHPTALEDHRQRSLRCKM